MALNSFDDMASKREEEAKQLDDMTIWISIIGKFVELDMPVEMRAQMILETVEDERHLVENAINHGIETGVFHKEKAMELLDAFLKLE
jgi:hypothetical protein